MSWKTTKTEKCKCLKCNRVLDLASNDDGESPQKGDISVCCYCGNIGQYDENLEILPLDKNDLMALKETQPNEYAYLIMIQKTFQ